MTTLTKTYIIPLREKNAWDIITGGNEEWSSLGWNHYHRVKRGRNAHIFRAKNYEDYCEKCEEIKRRKLERKIAKMKKKMGW